MLKQKANDVSFVLNCYAYLERCARRVGLITNARSVRAVGNVYRLSDDVRVSCASLWHERKIDGPVYQD